MLQVVSFAGQNWLITPAALAVNQAPPRSIADQEWLLILSGIAIVNFKGETSADWSRDTLYLAPDLQGPLNYAIAKFSIPRPPPNSSYNLVFQVDEWSPFAAISSIFDQNESINAGFAVDFWRPNPFNTGNDFFTNQPVNNIFTGILADLAVRDSDAYLYRVSYNISLLGKIVFTQNTIF